MKKLLFYLLIVFLASPTSGLEDSHDLLSHLQNSPSLKDFYSNSENKEIEIQGRMKHLNMNLLSHFDSSSFLGKNGEPKIPFISKAQLQLLQKEINTTEPFSISEYLQNELNKSLASEINQEIQNQIEQQIKEKAESAAISCKEAKTESLKTVCAMCGASKAYQLTSENWFVIGLAHNYKEEFAKFLYYVQYTIPNVRWLVAFGEHNICQVSIDPANDIDIDETLFIVTSRNLTYFVQSSLMPISNSSKAELVGFEYVPLGESKSFIIDFILKTPVNFSLSVADIIRLDFLTLWIRAKEERTIFVGTITLGSHSLIPFTADFSNPQEYYYIEGDLSESQISGYDLLSSLNIQEEHLFEGFSVLGNSLNLDEKIVTKVVFQIDGESKRITQMKIVFAKSPGFAVTPEIYFEDPIVSAVLDIVNDTIVPSISIEATAVDQTKQFRLKGYISVKKDNQEITLSALPGKEDLKLEDLEKLFQNQNLKFKGFLPSANIFEKLKNLYLTNLIIKIKQLPLPIYYINSTLDVVPSSQQFENSEGRHLGNIQSFITSLVEGAFNSLTVLDFPQGNLSDVFINATTFLEKFTTSKGIRIVNSDYNFMNSARSFDFFTDKITQDENWIKGTTMSINLLLTNCSSTVFCNMLNNILPTEEKEIRLSATLNEDTFACSSPVISNDALLYGLQLKNIKLNIAISSGIDVFLSFNHLLSVSNNQTLVSKGKVSFNETHGTYYSQISQPWFHVLNLDFLQIQGMIIEGALEPQSLYIIDTLGEGLLMWGTDCIKTDESRGISLNQENCFAGKGHASLDIQNISKSLIQGVYKNVTSLHIFKSILHYNITDRDESNQTMLILPQLFHHQFLNFVNILYAPISNEKTNDIGDQLQTDEGLIFEGQSKILDLQGKTILRINPTEKSLNGKFVFETIKVMFDNALLRGTDNSFKNELNFFKPSENALGQIRMRNQLEMFGLLNGNISWNFFEKNITINIDLTSDLFEEISVNGTSIDIEKIRTASFDLQGYVLSNFIQINQQLETKVYQLKGKIKKSLQKITAEYKTIENLLNEKSKSLCNNDTCKFVDQCTAPLSKTCVEYAPKTKCVSQVDQCKNIQIKCLKIDHINPFGENVTLTQDESDSSSVQVCQKFEYECSNDNINVCKEEKIVYESPELVCLRNEQSCKEISVQNPACKNECSQKDKEYEELEKYYNEIKQKFEDLNELDKGLNPLFNDLDLKGSPKVSEVSFNFMLDKKVDPKDIPWKIHYTFGEKSNSVISYNLDLMNFDKGLNTIYSMILTSMGINLVTIH